MIVNEAIVMAMLNEPHLVREVIAKVQTANMDELSPIGSVSRGELIEASLNHIKENIIQKVKKQFPNYWGEKRLDSIVITSGIDVAIEIFLHEANWADITELVDTTVKTDFIKRIRNSLLDALTLGLFRNQALKIVGWLYSLNLDLIDHETEVSISRAMVYLSLFYTPVYSKPGK